MDRYFEAKTDFEIVLPDGTRRSFAAGTIKNPDADTLGSPTFLMMTNEVALKEDATPSRAAKAPASE